MFFYNINWLLVTLIIIAGEIAILLKKLNGHIESLKVDKLEVHDTLKVTETINIKEVNNNHNKGNKK